MKNLDCFVLERLNEKDKKSRLEELKNQLEGLGYEDYVDKLNEMLKDPKSKALIEAAFGGELASVKLDKDSKPVVTSKLLPTQNEIDVDKSLRRGLTEEATVDAFFGKEPVTLGIPLLTYEGAFIIDGHHRWSQQACFNPKAKMAVVNYSGELSPVQMLKAVQGSIAADTGNVEVEKVHGMNLLKTPIRKIKKYIEDNITDAIVEKIIGYVDGLTDKDDVVDFICENVKKMQANNPPVEGASKRDYMPQTGKDPQIHSTLTNTTKIE